MYHLKIIFMPEKCDLLSAWIRTAESTVPDDRETRMEFWGCELRKTWNMLMAHEDHYISYIQEKAGSEKTAADGTIKRKEQQPDSGLRDLIAAGVGYFEYAQNKLNQLRSLRQNSYFLRA